MPLPPLLGSQTWPCMDLGQGSFPDTWPHPCLIHSGALNSTAPTKLNSVRAGQGASDLKGACGSCELG